LSKEKEGRYKRDLKIYICLCMEFSIFIYSEYI